MMRFAVRILPRPLLALGTWIGGGVACLLMPKERHHSTLYLEAILRRRPSKLEIWRHFHAFAAVLVAKIGAGMGRKVELVCEGQDLEHAKIIYADDPLLLGTFHVGASDLLGFEVSQTGRRLRMVRIRVGNSGDLAALTRIFGNKVQFVWVNKPEHLLFALRDALQADDVTVALQCDRTEGAERGEPFAFLGRQRLFRTSIYRLARIFDRKILFSVAVPEKGFHRFRIRAYNVFDGSGLDNRQYQVAAREHFQGVLNWLEAILLEHPYIWFNFLPLNPEVVPEPTPEGAQ